MKPGTDADGIEDEHYVFSVVYICDRTVIESWDFGLCLAYYYYWMIVTGGRIGMGDNHGGFIGFRDNPANRNIREYNGPMDIIVQQWLTLLN